MYSYRAAQSSFLKIITLWIQKPTSCSWIQANRRCNCLMSWFLNNYIDSYFLVPRPLTTSEKEERDTGEERSTIYFKLWNFKVQIWPKKCQQYQRKMLFLPFSSWWEHNQDWATHCIHITEISILKQEILITYCNFYHCCKAAFYGCKQKNLNWMVETTIATIA